MPRDGSGNYTLPYPAVVDGTTIESAVHNGTMSDIALQLNGPVPIIAGGTGANNAYNAMLNLKGEIAGQNVTNYSSHVFVAGSFWSVNATGGPTGDTGGFSGICHPYADPNYMTIEAREYAGAGVIGRVFVRQKSAGTWGTWSDQGSGSVADLDARYVNVAGDTMSGDLTLYNTNVKLAIKASGSVGTNWSVGDPYSVLISDLGSAGNRGPQLLFGDEGFGPWAGIKGLLQNGTGPAGDLVFQTREGVAGVPISERMRISNTGAVSITASYNAVNTVSAALMVAGGIAAGADIRTAGDVYAGSGATFGTIRFGNSASNYLHWDNSKYNFSASGPVYVGSTTASTSPTTGALTVAGGVGIGGALITGAAVYPGAASLGGFYMGAYDATHPIIAFEGGHYFMYDQTGHGLTLNMGSGYHAWFDTYEHIGYTTASSSKTSGALTVGGGVGVAGEIWANGFYADRGDGSYIQKLVYPGVRAWGVAISSTDGSLLFDDLTLAAQRFGMQTNGVFKAAGGYLSRAGTPGGFGTVCFNLNYAGGPFHLWADATNLGAIAISSDYRIKKDVIDLPGMWDTVKALRPIKYTQAQFTPPSHIEYKAKEAVEEAKVQRKLAEDSGKTYEAKPAEETQPLFPADDIERWGFIAHELQESLLPTAADGVKDAPDTIQSINLAPVVAALTKALQEAMTRIEALEAR